MWPPPFCNDAPPAPYGNTTTHDNNILIILIILLIFFSSFRPFTSAGRAFHVLSVSFAAFNQTVRPGLLTDRAISPFPALLCPPTGQGENGTAGTTQTGFSYSPLPIQTGLLRSLLTSAAALTVFVLPDSRSHFIAPSSSSSFVPRLPSSSARRTRTPLNHQTIIL